MHETEMKQLFDIVFMMVLSMAMIMALMTVIYLGLSFMYRKHKKSKVLDKIKYYIAENTFVKVVTHDKRGIPVMIEIVENKEQKIIVL